MESKIIIENCLEVNFNATIATLDPDVTPAGSLRADISN
jgi:hypothetical protein